jgi:membrane-bound lytic murein transglycosylase A
VRPSTSPPLAAYRKPLNQLVLAQDTGGAIRGAVRADYFWGFGEDAAREAGRMKQPLRMWVLLAERIQDPGSDSGFSTGLVTDMNGGRLLPSP